MQAATVVCFTGPLPIKNACLAPKTVPIQQRRITVACRKAIAAAASDSSTVNYSSLSSVFPAEACDIIGGDACSTQMCPEAKLPTLQSSGIARTAVEEVDREYFEYNQQKTVFPGEACDDLGGEFCEADYQIGVFGE